MPLPDPVRVKISTEDAGTIAITAVVVQEMPLRDLAEHILCATGPDAGRVREQLRRGSLVRGASRFRWEPCEPGEEEVVSLLATFPQADPERPFAAARCASVILRGRAVAIHLPREAAAKRRLLRRRSLWNFLVESAAEAKPRYVEYSYAERADVYFLPVDRPFAVRLRQEAELLPYAGLVRQIATATIDAIEFFVPRR
jgi:hypothetical protein